MDLGIEGRRAIVTGGSRGIGYETAKRFLMEGARVLVCARDGEGLEKARGELAALGEVAALRADTSEEGSAGKIVAAAEEAFGGVDILVNNAGEMSSGRFEVLSDTMLQTQLDTKLFGFLRMIRAVVPHMRKGGWGRIVNVASIAGLEGDKYITAYAAAKHAVVGFTRALAAEANGTRAEVAYGSMFIAMSGPDQSRAGIHTTIAVPGATAESTGFPTTRDGGGAYLMEAGTGGAHIMVPGR